jgi:hypothetical protein
MFLYNPSPTPHFSPYDILRKRNLKKNIKTDEKRLRKKWP